MLYTSRTKMLPEGCVVYLSQVGHYNFQYPDLDSSCVVIQDVVINSLPWKGPDNLIAALVPIYTLKCDNPLSNKKQIVWVKTSDIQLY